MEQLPPNWGPISGDPAAPMLITVAVVPLNLPVRDGPAPCIQSISGRVCMNRGVVAGICTPALHGLGHDGVASVACTIRSRKRKNGWVQPPTPLSGFGASGFT